ncbi:MAG: branched-chain amino acid ABC transporter permease [Myxococcales bacterium]
MNPWKQPPAWVLVGLCAIAGVAVILSDDDSLRETAFTVLMYATLASSLNLCVGYMGYVNFGHIVFFGLGGYLGFYLVSRHDWPIYSAAPVAGIAVSLLAALLGGAILRLRGAYFALATIGVNEAARSFVNNFPPFGGPTGLSISFSAYARYGGATRALWLAYLLLLVTALGSIAVSISVRHSRFGLGLLSIREDEDAALTMGVRAPLDKAIAYALSAFFPAVVGAIFFFKNGNVEPSDAFRLHTSIEVIVMVMLGGQGTVVGPLFGALCYERLRGVLLTTPVVKDLHLAVAGLLLLLIVLFLPAGAIGALRRRLPALAKVLP